MPNKTVQVRAGVRSSAGATARSADLWESVSHILALSAVKKTLREALRCSKVSALFQWDVPWTFSNPEVVSDGQREYACITTGGGALDDPSLADAGIDLGPAPDCVPGSC